MFSSSTNPRAIAECQMIFVGITRCEPSSNRKSGGTNSWQPTWTLRFTAKFGSNDAEAPPDENGHLPAANVDSCRECFGCSTCQNSALLGTKHNQSRRQMP